MVDEALNLKSAEAECIVICTNTMHKMAPDIIRESSREAYKKIIDKYGKEGAQGVILGCTEIPSLIKQKDVDIKVYDTTYIHAKAAVEFALD